MKTELSIGDSVEVMDPPTPNCAWCQSFLGTIKDIQENPDGSLYATVSDMDDEMYDIDLAYLTLYLD